MARHPMPTACHRGGHCGGGICWDPRNLTCIRTYPREQWQKESRSKNFSKKKFFFEDLDPDVQSGSGFGQIRNYFGLFLQTTTHFKLKFEFTVRPTSNQIVRKATHCHLICCVYIKGHVEMVDAKDQSNAIVYCRVSCLSTLSIQRSKHAMHWMLCLSRLSIHTLVFVALTQHLIQSTMRCENSV